MLYIALEYSAFMKIMLEHNRKKTVVPSYLWGCIQDPQWISETTDSTEPYIYYVFS